MLFNSHIFIFVFFPIVFLGFYKIGQYSHSLASLWLAAASLFFYGWWDSRFIGLLLASITFNYAISYFINIKLSQRKLLLIIGITTNLLLIAYYKYANFFLDSLKLFLSGEVVFESFILPLGISFFTFTQIAFLVDTYQGKVKEYNFVHYILFVTYFPHLIAGPVLHHKEMMPQFSKKSIYSFNYDNLLIGTIIFFIGLFKKTVLADHLSEAVNPIFSSSNSEITLNFIDAWGGSLSYTFQLYFDFSGYSDMAIGLSRMFGVKLPLNFHSPYKALNIIDFWRRWHMTLSRFLRDYLYIPLGGNRKGKIRRHINLFITMLLGGLWHGAGWTFVIWGGLHGIYLIINHGWQSFRFILGQDILKKPTIFMRIFSISITFLSVSFAWVVFRAKDINAAISILRTMLGLNGISLPSNWLFKWELIRTLFIDYGITFNVTAPILNGQAMMWLLVSILLVWFTPNTQQIMSNFEPCLDTFDSSDNKILSWKPSHAWLIVSIFCSVIALLSISDLSEFIYFQF